MSQEETLTITGNLIATCRYGENAWQFPAEVFALPGNDPFALKNFKSLEGFELSYNNRGDLNRLLQVITHIAAVFDLNSFVPGGVPLIAVGVKHGNACGAAVGLRAVEVLRNMIAGDPRALFGGWVMTNFSITEVEAEILVRHKSGPKKRILDGVVAPSISSEAIKLLRRQDGKHHIMVHEMLVSLSKDSLDQAPHYRYCRGEIQRQPNYTYVLNLYHEQSDSIGWRLSTQDKQDLLLAWAVCATSNSNTVTIVRDGYLIGNGVGQQDRVLACKLAVLRAREAGHGLKSESIFRRFLEWLSILPLRVGGVVCSDSFFPFTDGPKVLIKAGVTTILATSGSKNDDKVKEVCAKAKIRLYMISDAVGRGFYGH